MTTTLSKDNMNRNRTRILMAGNNNFKPKTVIPSFNKLN